MREPLGDKPWDEDENGKDVLHLSNGKVSALSLKIPDEIQLIFSKYPFKCHRL